eukprot:TRINITY_DN81347_c0_g1_i1.p1 TRINITY_DN81347_c0_g1~~TRINITY_DN81347_c0_g1_i1.p1  ORF type:complete len:410 (+),score=93.35 TRINITY_DN81347_c0_g1_i1:17-1246(+)
MDSSSDAELEQCISGGAPAPQACGRSAAIVCLVLTATSLSLGAVAWHQSLHRRHVEQVLQSGESLRGSFCNREAEIAMPQPPHRFHLPPEWQERCKQLPHPKTRGKPVLKTDWCWEYLKHNGCYASHGYTTWKEDQQRLSQQGMIPKPDVFSLDPVQHPEVCEQKRLGSVWQLEEVAASANSWFLANVAVYVINLASAKDRLEAVSSRLNQLQIPFERAEGVDLTLPEALQAAEKQGLVPHGFNGSLGTAGCAAAHLQAMRHASARTHKPLVLILEDDVWLHDGFAAKAKALLQREAPCNWQAISLKSRCPYGRCISQHLMQVVPDGNEPDACGGVNFGFFAMLYRRESLDLVVKQLSSAIWEKGCHNIDVALAGISDSVSYFAVPGVQQPGLIHEVSGFSSLREARNR